VKTVRFLFNDAMSRAIVEGRKTVTRRPVMPQPAEWPSTGEGLWRGGRRFPHDGGPDPLATCASGDMLIGMECFQAWTGGEMSGHEEADGVLDSTTPRIRSPTAPTAIARRSDGGLRFTCRTLPPASAAGS
jgi:hypothetical protein